MNFTLQQILNNKATTLYNVILFNKLNTKHTLTLQSFQTINSVKDLNLYFTDTSDNLHKVAIHNYSSTSTQLIIDFYTELPEAEYKNSLLLNVYINGTMIKQYVEGIKLINVSHTKLLTYYIKDVSKRIEPNYLIERTKANVPRWSKAFTEDVSNFTKILDPFITYVNTLYQKVNHSNTEYVSSVNDKPYRVLNSDSQSLLNYFNNSNSNYKNINTQFSTSVPLLTFIYVPDVLFTPEEFIEDCKLYIKKNTTGILDVQIEGLNSKLELVKEYVYLVDEAVKESLNKFKTILKIISSEALEISNHLDCTKNYSYIDNDVGINPVFINKFDSFNNYQPIYKLETNASKTFPLLTIYSDIKPMYKYSIDVGTIDSLFVDKNLNVYLTSGSVLYQSNLGINNKSFSTTINENVNKYIYTEDEILVGDWITVYIDFPTLVKEKEINNAIVVMQYEDTIKYLSKDLSVLTDTKTVISGEYLNKIFKFDMLIEQVDSYSFSVNTDKGSYKLNISPSKLNMNYLNLSNASKLYIYNSEMYLYEDVNTQLIKHYNKIENIVFYWDSIRSVDFELDFNGYLVNTKENNLDDNLIHRITSDGNTYVESYKLNIDLLMKSIFNNQDVVFTVKAYFDESDNILITDLLTSKCKMLINTKTGTSKEIDLHPKLNSLTHEYTITMNQNSITEVLNVNY